jgi:hypothetical protein
MKAVADTLAVAVRTWSSGLLATLSRIGPIARPQTSRC